jgi:hypothetical protein
MPPKVVFERKADPSGRAETDAQGGKRKIINYKQSTSIVVEPGGNPGNGISGFLFFSSGLRHLRDEACRYSSGPRERGWLA